MFTAKPGTFRHIFRGRGYFGGWQIERWSEFGLIAIEEWATADLRLAARAGGIEFFMGRTRR